MKKLGYILLLTLALVSCRGRDGIDGRNGINGKDGADMNWDVFQVTVSESPTAKMHWEYSAVDTAYLCNVFDEGNLTKFIAESGLVNVYLQYVNNDGELIQSPLPYIRHYSGYTETYDYEFTTDRITIYVTRSDHNTSVVPPTTDFRIVYNW